jgi:hypothetical protein
MSQENVEAVPQESIVLATFKDRFAAERMLASLGRTFRREALAGKANVFVISANADGSLKLTESRAVQASGLVSTGIRVTGALLAGFMGLFSTLKEAFRVRRATRARASHVGPGDIRSHEILAQVGPDAAAALVRCKDEEIRHKVSEKAADSAVGTWDGSLAEFLAALDPGSKHDWVRDALGVPSGADDQAAGSRE